MIIRGKTIKDFEFDSLGGLLVLLFEDGTYLAVKATQEYYDDGLGLELDAEVPDDIALKLEMITQEEHDKRRRKRLDGQKDYELRELKRLKEKYDD